MSTVTAIFDVGKTNKKLLLFNSGGSVLREHVTRLAPIMDDDGFPCEDIGAVRDWLLHNLHDLLASSEFDLKAVNFTAYGASLVHLDDDGEPATPLYDYLKPVPAGVVRAFHNHLRVQYGQDLRTFTRSTCSPKLAMLNAGFQLYWLKKKKPQHWARIRHSLHLPQYLSYLVTGKRVSDYTSLGCHTAMWDFEKFRYTAWVTDEFRKRLAPITDTRSTSVKIGTRTLKVGWGLHDSSAALIPFRNPDYDTFIFISTGTWSIQLNPFNDSTLTTEQLRKDCLCYMQTDGQQVKAARLLLGLEHDHQVKRLAEHFAIAPEEISHIPFDEATFWRVRTLDANRYHPACMQGTGPRPQPARTDWSLTPFASPQEAYHALIIHLVSLLKESIQLIDKPRVKTLFVDGGFARNEVFMKTLACLLYQKRVVASYLPQATALGAFMHVHNLVRTGVSDFDQHFQTYRPALAQMEKS